MFNNDKRITSFTGQLDQLEDRYIGIVEVASSNLALSTSLLLSLWYRLFRTCPVSYSDRIGESYFRPIHLSGCALHITNPSHQNNKTNDINIADLICSLCCRKVRSPEHILLRSKMIKYGSSAGYLRTCCQ